MKKTISQRFFLSLCLMIVGCLWGSAAWAETITLNQTTIGSLLGTSSYESSDFTYSGITWGRTKVYSNDGGIQIDGGTSKALWNKTAIPGAITKIIVTQKTNPSTLTVGTKTRPTTNRNSTAASSTATYTFNASDKFQYFQIAATNKYSVVTSVEIIYEPLAAINVSADALTFGDIETGYNDTKTFSISGMKLTADATLEITGTNAAMFSVSPTTITATDGNIAATDVTVTYTPTATGDHSATLTISSGDLSREVSLSGTGIAPLTHYTVSWMVNGETYTAGTPTTDVAEGRKVKTLPTNPANIGTNVFMGWTASAISGTSAVAPGDLFTTAKDAPAVTSNTTYYAVFAEATANGTHWEEIKTLPEPGRYAILSDSYFMSSTISSNRFKNGTTTPQISGTTPATLTAAPSENCIWEFTKPDNYYRIANGGKYAGGTSSTSNQGAMLSDASNNYAKWTIEYIGSSFTISNYGRRTSENNCLRNNDDYGWACYKSSTGKAPRLFKETTSYTYSNYATTIVVKEEAGLAFERATYIVDVNEIITVTATNASGATITYSVDDDTHAMVSESTGEFYADAVGTYTITATCPATKTHSAGMTTCQVIVTQPSGNIHATTYYKKITSSDELVDGGVYLIVCKSRNEAMGVIDDKRCLGATITLSNNTYTGSVNQSDHPYEVTITKGNNGYYNLYHAGGKYINIQSNTSKADFTFAATGDNGWSISFDNSGNALISNKNHSNKAGNYIQRYSSDNYYKNYQSGQESIQLYQKVGEMPIAKATGGVTTYVADFAYVMPQHLTGHTVALAEKEDIIVTEKAFRAGDEVPAFTPLLIKSDEDYDAEENSRNYNPAVLNKTVEAYTGENMLEYRRTAENYTNTMKNGSVYYYKLAIKDGKVGFYWGATGGAAFIMTKPSTAYLTVPVTTKVQGFVLNLEEGETTGIATVVTNEDAPIYNLQGIRMNGKNLPKGIYIQGGKKFMVK